MGRGEAEAERLPTEPRAQCGAQFPDPEIVTEAEGSHPTD